MQESGKISFTSGWKGLFLGILREDLLIVSLVLTVAGLLGMLLFAVTWFIRPKIFNCNSGD
ncbi:hypothetical protein OESDEN_10262 [Oesophagostomum dentatum]|uniref:Uncharacterized protein n=1 Tax=Oesophagostomum dentatum TaxID=61180 RepID=A0A0B1SX65_OESDE|nr:hypothetical protein OESDEN_10262 [Oesophagostomum dentatum]